MKNCIQTVVVTGSDPDELQENLNAWLLPLGKNVKNVQIIPLHNNSLVAVITYEANNPSLEMEEKIGALICITVLVLQLQILLVYVMMMISYLKITLVLWLRC